MSRRPICIGASVPQVVAYVAEPCPVRGPDGLLAQLATIRRRAGRDGAVIGRLIADSGGATTRAGLGRRLALTAAAAACEPAPRILYLADTRHLASDPAAELEALRLLFQAGFEVRSACGRISPRGRRVAALRRAAALAATSASAPTATRGPPREHPWARSGDAFGERVGGIVTVAHGRSDLGADAP